MGYQLDLYICVRSGCLKTTAFSVSHMHMQHNCIGKMSYKPFVSYATWRHLPEWGKWWGIPPLTTLSCPLANRGPVWTMSSAVLTFRWRQLPGSVLRLWRSLAIYRRCALGLHIIICDRSKASSSPSILLWSHLYVTTATMWIKERHIGRIWSLAVDNLNSKNLGWNVN